MAPRQPALKIVPASPSFESEVERARAALERLRLRLVIREPSGS